MALAGVAASVAALVVGPFATLLADGDSSLLDVAEAELHELQFSGEVALALWAQSAVEFEVDQA